MPPATPGSPDPQPPPLNLDSFNLTLESVLQSTGTQERAALRSARRPDEIGRLGHYRVLRLLGQGGMGAVYLAEDTKLKRHVALKVMKFDLSQSEAGRARFQREAEAAAAVTHDHIVPIYHVGEDQGTTFLAMPFLHGQSLGDALKTTPQPATAAVLKVGREAALGLAAAHAAGLIHRDVKPANLWLERLDDAAHAPLAAGASVLSLPAPRWRAKVLDFGLARPTQPTEDSFAPASPRSTLAADDISQAGTVLGTPAYMAPEQARGLTVDARADLFSLGCVLYEMMTGRRPFRGADMFALLTSLAVDTPPAPMELNPSQPAALSDLVMRLLAKKPEERPASARAVAEELHAIERALRHAAVPMATPVSLSAPAEAEWDGLTTEMLPASLAEAKRHSPARSKLALSLWTATVLGFCGLASLVVLHALRPGASPTTTDPSPPPPSPTYKPSKLDLLRAMDIPPEERRNSTWHPPEIVALLGSELGKHRGPVHNLVFHPDNKLMATVDEVAVRLWDIATGREVGMLATAPSGCVDLVFSPDGKWLAIALSGGGEVILWHTKKRDQRRIPNGGNLRQVAFSFDSRTLAVASDGIGVTVYSTDTLEPRWNWKPPEPYLALSVVFSPSGDVLAIGATGARIILLDTASEEELGTLRTENENVRPVIYSPEGNTLYALADGPDGVWPMAMAWNVVRHNQVWRFRDKRTMTMLSLGAGGKDLFLDGWQGLRRLDASSGQPLSLHKLPWAVSHLGRASPDGGVFGQKHGQSQVQVWSLAEDRLIREFGGICTPTAVAFAPTAPEIAVVRMPAVGDCELARYTLPDLTKPKLAKMPGTGGTPIVTYSPDGSLLAASNDSGITVWPLEPAGERRFFPFSQCRALAISPDNRWLIATSEKGRKLWDLTRGVEGPALPNAPYVICNVSFSPTGETVAMSGPDNSILLWDVKTWKQSAELPAAKDTLVKVVFLPGGTRILARTVRENVLWDVPNKKPIAQLDATYEWVTALVVAPDGKTFISATERGVTRYSTETLRQLNDWPLRNSGGWTDLAYAPDGRHLAIGNPNGTVYILRLAK